jgi:antitoxin component YwqK of YwqJK toxin-antitoxin module
MKKLGAIMFFLSMIMIGCTEKRVLMTELKESGGLAYYQGEPFTGIGFLMYNESQLGAEQTFKDGKLDGVTKFYGNNGQLEKEILYKNGKRDGVTKWYGEDGQLVREETFKDGWEVK